MESLLTTFHNFSYCLLRLCFNVRADEEYKDIEKEGDVFVRDSTGVD
jgi:hypothetical protein